MLARYLPAVGWLRRYRGAWLRGDLVAGVTTAAVVIPRPWHTPPSPGCLSRPAPVRGHRAHGRLRPRRHLPAAVGQHHLDPGRADRGRGDPAGRRRPVAGPGGRLHPGRLSGLLLGGAGLLPLGFLADFISAPVLAGFKAGTGLLIAAGQLGKLLGVPLGIGLAMTTGLAERGVELVGTIPPGLPRLALPDLDLTGRLLGPAAGVALMAFVESIAAARAFTGPTEQEVDADQELRALGAANLAGGCFQAFPAGGGLSQTAVNHASGARTQVAGLAAAMVVVLTLLFLTPLFEQLPQATLGRW